MASLIGAYLSRLGLSHPGPPSVENLHALHTAHVERIAYETFDLYLGRPPGIDPVASAERIAHLGRGGYCYHLNGAMSVLLEALGYRVSRHVAGVQVGPDHPARATGNHLALVVDGLPSRESPDGRWMVDVGLGDALHAPLPLRTGRHQQGPFIYALQPWATGWRLDHDPRGSFLGVNFTTEPSTMDAFAGWHTYLASSPDSRFVATATAQRRDASGVDILRGCLFTRIAANGGYRRLVTDRDAWFQLLADRFGLTFDEFDGATRNTLWERVSAR